MASETTETESLPAHVEAALVGVAVVAPALFLPILVGPRETAVVLGVGAVLALLGVGVAAMVLLERA